MSVCLCVCTPATYGAPTNSLLGDSDRDSNTARDSDLVRYSDTAHLHTHARVRERARTRAHTLRGRHASRMTHPRPSRTAPHPRRPGSVGPRPPCLTPQVSWLSRATPALSHTQGVPAQSGHARRPYAPTRRLADARNPYPDTRKQEVEKVYTAQNG